VTHPDQRRGVESSGGAVGGAARGAGRGASRTAPPNPPPTPPNSPGQHPDPGQRRGPERPWRVPRTGNQRTTRGDVVLSLQARLTDRDKTLLGWLADHDVLTTPQIAHALFSSTGFTQRRLLTLHRAGLTDRFRPLRPGGGAYPWHHVLAPLGAQHVAATRDQPPPRPSAVVERNRRIATSRTLHHRLGVNTFFTDLAAHARTHPHTRLERWWSETRCAAPGAFAPGLISPIRPDGHGIWTGPGPGPDGRRVHVAFFLEYDLGGESHPVLRAKLDRYATHAARGGPAWPVLFVLPSQPREERLHEYLNNSDGAVTVATVTADRIAADGPAAAVWRTPRSTDPLQTLIDLAR
jgi:hypothetical protein